MKNALDRLPRLSDAELAAPDDDSVGGAFTQGLRSGTTAATGQLAAVGGLVSPMLRAKSMELQRQAAQEAEGLPTWDTMRFGQNGMRWAAGTIGQMLPQAVPAVGAGLLTGGGAVPAMLAGTAATVPFTFGSQLQRQDADPANAGATPGMRAQAAFLPAVGNAAVQNIVPATVAGRLMGKGAQTTIGGAVARGLADIPANGVAGAAGEGIAQWGDNRLNPNAGYDPEAVRHAGVEGAAMGGLFGAMGAAGHLAHRGAGLPGRAYDAAAGMIPQGVKDATGKAVDTAVDRGGKMLDAGADIASEQGGKLLDAGTKGASDLAAWGKKNIKERVADVRKWGEAFMNDPAEPDSFKAQVQDAIRNPGDKVKQMWLAGEAFARQKAKELKDADIPGQLRELHKTIRDGADESRARKLAEGRDTAPTDAAEMDPETGTLIYEKDEQTNIQKVTRWGQELLDKVADPAKRAELQKALGSVADKASQQIIAKAKMAVDAAGRMGKYISDFDYKAEFDKTVAAKDAAKRSDDYSGARQAVGRVVRDVLGTDHPALQDPKHVDRLAQALIPFAEDVANGKVFDGFERLHQLNALYNIAGEQSGDVLNAVHKLVSNAGADDAAFYKNVQQLGAIQQGRQKVLETMRKNLRPELQDLPMHELQTEADMLMKWATHSTRNKVDAAKAKFDNERVLAALQHRYGDKADLVLAAVEKNVARDTQVFERSRSQVDDEGNEIGVKHGDDEGSREYTPDADLDRTDYFPQKGHLYLHPDHAEGNGTYKSAVAQQMAKAQAAHPDSRVVFRSASELGVKEPRVKAQFEELIAKAQADGMDAKTARAFARTELDKYGAVTAERAKTETRISTGELRAMKLNSDYGDSPTRIDTIGKGKAGNVALDATKIIKMMKERMRGDGVEESSVARDVRALKEGLAALQEHLGYRFDIPDSVQIRRGKDALTWGDAQAMARKRGWGRDSEQKVIDEHVLGDLTTKELRDEGVKTVKDLKAAQKELADGEEGVRQKIEDMKRAKIKFGKAEVKQLYGELDGTKAEVRRLEDHLEALKREHEFRNSDPDDQITEKANRRARVEEIQRQRNDLDMSDPEQRARERTLYNEEQELRRLDYTEGDMNSRTEIDPFGPTHDVMRGREAPKDAQIHTNADGSARRETLKRKETPESRMALKLQSSTSKPAKALGAKLKALVELGHEVETGQAKEVLDPFRGQTFTKAELAANKAIQHTGPVEVKSSRTVMSAGDRAALHEAVMSARKASDVAPTINRLAEKYGVKGGAPEALERTRAMAERPDQRALPADKDTSRTPRPSRGRTGESTGLGEGYTRTADDERLNIYDGQHDMFGRRGTGTKEGTPDPKAVAAKKAAFLEAARSGDPELIKHLETSTDAKGLQRAVLELKDGSADRVVDVINKRLGELVQNEDVRYGMATKRYSLSAASKSVAITARDSDSLAGTVGKIGPIENGVVEARRTEDGDVVLSLYDGPRINEGAVLAFDMYKNADNKWEVGMDGPQAGTGAFERYKSQFDYLTDVDPYNTGVRGEYTKFRDGVFSAAETRLLFRTLRDWATELGVSPDSIVYGRDTGVNPGRPYKELSAAQIAHLSMEGVDPSATGPVDRKAVGEHLEKVLGPQIQLDWAKILHAGEFSVENGREVIRLSVHSLNPVSTAYHESLHAFFRRLTRDDHGDIAQVLERTASSPSVMKQLRELLKDEPAALKQLSNTEERAAYMYQFWALNKLKVGEQAQGVFARVAKFLRKVLGMWTNDERALHIMEYFHSGEYQKGRGDVNAVRRATMEQGRNAAVEKLKTWAEPVRNIQEALMTAGGQRLRDTGIPALRELADVMKLHGTSEGTDAGFIPAARQERSRRMNQLANDLAPYEQKTLDEAREAMQRGVDAKSKEAKSVVALVQQHLAESLKYMQDAGVDVTAIAGDNAAYFPRAWDSSYISSHQKEFRAMLQKYVDSGHFKGDPNKLMSKLIVTDGMEFTNETDKPGMQFVKERVLKFIDHEDAAPFVRKDLLGIMNSYVSQATRRAEWSRRLGGENDGLHQIVARAKNQGATDKQIDAAMKYVRAVDGTLGDDINPTTRRLMGDVIVYQNIRLLPLAIFSSVIDPMGLVVRGGTMHDAWKTFKRGIAEMSHNFKDKPTEDEATQFAATVGTIDNTMLIRSLGASYSQGMVGDTGRAFNDKFFRYNLMEQFNTSMRVGATEAALGFIKRHTAGESAHSMRYLAELGLTKDDVHLDSNGRLKVLEDDGLSLEHAAKMKSAINRWVDGAVLRPDAADKPIWMSDPHYALISHLKQFVFSFHETVLKRVMHEMDHGNFTAAYALASYVPIMLASDLVKGMIQGAGSQPAWKQDWDALDYLGNATERAGIWGTGQFGIDAVKDVAHGGAAIGAVAGPSIDQLADALRVMGGREQFGHFALKSMPANALYSGFLGGGAPDPKFAD